MKKRWQKTTSVLVMALMLLTMLPAVAMGDDQPAVTLEQAIQKVKQNFTVPAEFTEFSSGFNSSDNGQSWSLNWTDKENRKGSFSATVDASTGTVTAMHIYRNDRPAAEIPKVSLEQAQKIGMDLLKQLIPDRIEDLQYVSNQQLVPLNRWDGGQYGLRWQRMANQVPVGNEGVTMQINSSDGSINSYDLNWSNKTIPEAKDYISADKANEVFAANKMLELQYLIIPQYSLLRTAEGQDSKLVYRLTHNSNGVIDAVSGQPMENQNRYGIDIGGMGSARAENAKSADLSPQEQAEVDNIANLISQERAISIAQQWVTLPDGAQLQEANLYKDYQNPKTRIWNFSWRSAADTQDSYYYGAQVDAVTGELRSFYIDQSAYNDKKPVLDQAAAEKIARNFISKIQPEKSKSVRLADNYQVTPYLKDSSYPQQWYFNFVRLANNIPCTSQGISVSVDSRSKQVVSYDLDWPDMKFPDSSGTLGIDKANTAFLKNQPMTLHYELIYPEGSTGDYTQREYRLVYSPVAPQTSQQSTLIDAISGEPLNWDGTSVSSGLQPQTFTDIAGNFAEKEIAMLGQAGIMTEYGSTFHPQEQITLVTLVRAMLIAHNGYINTGASDEEIINIAVNNKWLAEKMQPNTVVTNALLAQITVRVLDIDFVAHMQESALQAPYKDFAAMGADLKGYAALTWGLGIIKGDGVNFNASHQVTRAEAAAVLIRTMNVAGQKINY
ncbi:MAG TPA: YcdB/YcdC domain-containing protein [Syntrophomonas sp.]|nr:YcdB/YcdC domain-containing protein [Syntrophomonas sp.]